MLVLESELPGRICLISAQAQLGTIIQDDQMMTAKPRMNLPDAAHIDDRVTMDAYEFQRIEFAAKAGERFAQIIFAAGGMQSGIVTRGFDPIDVRGRHENDATCLAHR